MNTRFLIKRQRLATSKESLKNSLLQIQTEGDLVKLKEYMGMAPDSILTFANMNGTTDDFQGTDFRTLENYINKNKVTEKNRQPGRSALAIEIARYHEFLSRSPCGDYRIVFGFGRDMMCLTPDEIIAYYDPILGFPVAQDTDKTQHDYIMLRTTEQNPIFIKSSLILPHATFWMEKCKELFLDMVPRIQDTFNDGKDRFFSQEMGCPNGIDLCCLREPIDKKTVIYRNYNGGGDMTKENCAISKMMMFIEIEESFEENQFVIVGKQ